MRCSCWVNRGLTYTSPQDVQTTLVTCVLYLPLFHRMRESALPQTLQLTRSISPPYAIPVYLEQLRCPMVIGMIISHQCIPPLCHPLRLLSVPYQRKNRPEYPLRLQRRDNYCMYIVLQDA